MPDMQPNDSVPQDPPLKARLRAILKRKPEYTTPSLIVAMRPTPPEVTLRLLAEILDEEAIDDGREVERAGGQEVGRA
jgi:hypothetical protein